MNYTKADQFISRLVAMLAVVAMLFSSVPLALAEEVPAPTSAPQEEPAPTSAPEEVTPSSDDTVVNEEVSSEESVTVSALDKKPKNPKITICHYDNGHGGRDGSQTVDLESTGPKGHTGHSNDIIPDVDEDGDPSNAAHNWTTEGQAIWNNDCKNTGNLIVDKVVVGTTTVKDKDFKLFVGDKSVEDNKKEDFAPGTYTVSETPKQGVPAGFTTTFSGACNANGQVTVAVGQTKTCTITNTYPTLPPPPAKVATFVASKVVCTNEADLPNWGTGGPDITATTAADWIATHPGCSLASGWDFEWVLDSKTTDPGDTLVGPAGGDWTTFGQTDGSGKTTLALTAAQLAGNTKVWFREVLKPGYIAFTHEADSTNGNNVSAELYCHKDAINYDNYDFVNGIELDKTYYCVAFNVPTEVPVVKYPITGAKWHDTNKDGIWDNGELGIEDWVIVLKDGAGAVIATTTTDENGEYAFSVPAGSYVVSEEQQTDWTQTAPQGDTCSFTFTDGIKQVAIGNVCNFGNYYTAPTVPVCKIGKNLLQNGSFEEPVVNGDWSIFNSVVNWTISLSDGLEVWRNFYGGASEGVQNVELDGNASTRITQTVATTPGATYELRFDFSARPDSDSALHNSVEAFVGTTSLLTVTADGSDIAQNTWTTHSQTFTATGASTDISFEDNGLSDSYGTLLDNAVLCLVREPEPAPSCKVTVISDTTNMVDEAVDTNAVLAWVHPNWVQELTGSLAKWIWSSYEVEDPAGATTKTFVKTFTWNGPVSAAVLDIATDNTYVVKLNGVQVAADPTEDNFSSVDTHNVAAEVDQGLNTLEITVTNNAYPTNDPKTNPAGLLYNLTITDTQSAECQNGGGNGDEDLYRISGYVWHDDNANQIWDGREMEGEELMEGESEADLSGWVVKITNGAGDDRTTLTDENGYYYFDVPAGTWTVTEEVQSGWTRTTAESHVVVVGGMSFLEAVKNFLLPVAHAATIISEYGENNFGNDIVPGGGGSNGGSSRSSGSSSTRVSRGALSSATPAPMVLGEQVSIIPDGSPKTGHGGTSQNFNSLTFGQLLLLTRRNNLIK